MCVCDVCVRHVCVCVCGVCACVGRGKGQEKENSGLGQTSGGYRTVCVCVCVTVCQSAGLEICKVVQRFWGPVDDRIYWSSLICIGPLIKG